ncbi:MAG: ABC transporter substrate-binding protein [Dehalococcoidia bacterium]
MSARPRAIRALSLVTLAILALSALGLVACSDGEDAEATTATTESTSSATTTASPTEATPTPEPRQITFMAGFRAQANLPFVAVYVAEAEGFFAEEGLEVEIQHSSGQDEHLKLLLDGEVQFTTGTAAQAVRRAQEGLPVRAIALFGQRGDQGYVARADSGIETPADFAGHTVGFKAGVVPAELVAMLASAGLTEDDVELVGVGFDPRVFMEGGVDVYPVFLNNEPDTIRTAGVEINVIDPHDFGVPTLGLTYLATEETLADTDLVERFLRATMKAAHWIEEHPEEAIAITLLHAEGADAAHQRYLLDTDLAAAQREDGHMGISDDGQWEALVELLVEHAIIPESVAVQNVLDQAVLQRLYEEGAFD